MAAVLQLPMNPLGVRALYLGSSTYRIHGTDSPWTIGTAVSKGCIRMYNQDVLDLYPPPATSAPVFATDPAADRNNAAPMRADARLAGRTAAFEPTPQDRWSISVAAASHVCGRVARRLGDAAHEPGTFAPGAGPYGLRVQSREFDAGMKDKGSKARNRSILGLG